MEFKDTSYIRRGLAKAKAALNKFGDPMRQGKPRPTDPLCITTGCLTRTTHDSGLCPACRYHDEMDRTEVRYEVAVAKTVRPSLESLMAPDGAREVSCGE